MSEHLSALAQTQSAPVPETRAERRKIRRTGISLQVRVRTAAFDDGNFDEVRTTQNASRKAFYFLTDLNRYYKGMSVRVTFPYDPNAGTANLEQVGEVVRVHRREDGYGVAVAILAAQPASVQSAGASGATKSDSAQTTSIASSAPNERRCGTRSPFIAPIEMVEMRTGSRIKARTSDLSLQGCYVDTLNALQVGAAVRLQIHRAGLILDVLANVSSRHAGSGMGMEFGEITQAQRAVLENWLNELGVAQSAIFENPLALSRGTSTNEPDRAARLVRVLLRKGLLSQSEAKEVLEECEVERRGVRPLPDAL